MIARSGLRCEREIEFTIIICLRHALKGLDASGRVKRVHETRVHGEISKQ